MTTTSESSVIHLRPRPRKGAEPSEFLTKKEVADRFRVSTRTVERWMERGTIPYICLDGNPLLPRFPSDRLEEWAKKEGRA